MNRYKTLLCMVGALAVAILPSMKAHDAGLIIFSGTGTATIDGVLSPGEWDGSDTFEFAANLPAGEGGGTTPATLFVMNDDTNLYLAVQVQRNTPAASVAFFFDNDHDGVREVGDDAIRLESSGLLGDLAWSDQPPCSVPGCHRVDTYLGGTIDVLSAAGQEGAFSFHELSHPLDSSDDLHDFTLTTGDTVGFRLTMNLCAGVGDCGFTYVGGGPAADPTSYGDIVIAPSGFVQGECGQTIYESVILSEDIGPCSGDGIIVGADTITVEGDGHRVVGSGAGDGIVLFGRSDVIVAHLFVEDFSRGIVIEGGTGNQVLESQIRNNDNGVDLAATTDTLVTRNVIDGNSVGVFAGSAGNHVYHNVIFKNTTQIQELGGNNWTDPLENLGNYWGNYWGQDDGSDGRIAGDFVGDTYLPHEGVDPSPLLDPSIVASFGAMMCDDWWSYSSYLIWRGGWSPMVITVTDPLGRNISRDLNELGKDGFYIEDDAFSPGSTLVHALIGTCTKYNSMNGNYAFEVTGLADLTYWMEWYVTAPDPLFSSATESTENASDRTMVLLYNSVEDVFLADGETQTVDVLLDVTTEPDTGAFVAGTAQLSLDVDIKPGSDPNSINLSSAGVVPVAILSQPTFDATTIDPDTVTLEGASVKLVGKAEHSLCHWEDANGDGLDDMVCQVLTDELELEVGDSMAELTASTFDGTSVRGEDAVSIVPD